MKLEVWRGLDACQKVVLARDSIKKRETFSDEINSLRS